MAAQPDGAFPRVNLAMVKSGKYDNMIVSLVCRHVEYDGGNTLKVECADGGAMAVQVEEGYEFVPGRIVEIMGHLQDGETPLQHFVTRSVGEGMALDVYNDMLSQVYTNPKYKDLFNPMQV